MNVRIEDWFGICQIGIQSLHLVAAPNNALKTLSIWDQNPANTFVDSTPDETEPSAGLEIKE